MMDEIPVEEKPLSIKSKIEHLNALALHTQNADYMIYEKEERQILFALKLEELLKERIKELDHDEFTISGTTIKGALKSLLEEAKKCNNTPSKS